MALGLNAQNITVKGTVTDNTGELDPFFIDSDDYLHVVLQADEGEMVFYCKKR